MAAPVKSALSSDRIHLSGYADFLDHFDRSGWTDGLPVVPPTEEAVATFLETAGIEPHQVVGVLAERQRETTAEKVAINAVMAGCRPEYFPVVLAAWQAVCTPEWNLNSGALTTSGPAPLVIVNGPVTARIGMRSRTNLFGPGNRANATIGRALRLLLINLAGAGEQFDMACVGHPGKYSYCIAEDEDASQGWEPLHVQRGFSREQSAVTVVNLEAPQQVRDAFSNTPEMLLDNFCDHIKSWNQGGACVIVVNAEHRRLLTDAAWTKNDVAAYLFKKATRTVGDLKRTGRLQGRVEPGDDRRDHTWFRSPSDFLIVGGGSEGQFSAVIPPWAGGVRSEPVSRLVPEPGCAGECLL